jgi:hypothetical protein
MADGNECFKGNCLLILRQKMDSCILGCDTLSLGEYIREHIAWIKRSMQIDIVLCLRDMLARSDG